MPPTNRSWLPMPAGALFLTLTVAASLVFAWSDKDDPAAKDAPSVKPETEAAAGPKVPAGTPEEQLDFLADLKEQAPDVQTREAAMAHFKKVFGLIATTTETLLQQPLKEPTKVKAQTARLEALSILGRLGDANAKKQALAMAEEFQGHKDADLAGMAQTLVLQQSLNNLLEGDKKEAPKLIKKLEAYLGGKVSQQHLQSSMTIAQLLEQVGEYDAAKQAHESMRRAFHKSSDANLAAAAEEFSKTAEKRLAVIGKPMELAGAKLDGEPLDWSQYKGKVVLVDFWATWCGPCVAEMPNVKKNYDKYHERGFEVVGISLDEDRKALEDFVKENKLPWTTLFSDDPTQNQKLADRYGVSGIPALFLVGPDGNVLTLKARGEDLGEQLEKLLGGEKKKKS